MSKKRTKFEELQRNAERLDAREDIRPEEIENQKQVDTRKAEQQLRYQA